MKKGNQILRGFKSFNEVEKSILNPNKLDNNKYSIFSSSQITSYLKNVISKNEGMALEIQKSVVSDVKSELNHLIPVNIKHNNKVKKFYIAKTGVCAELEKAVDPVNKQEGYFDNKINEDDVLTFIKENEDVDDEMLIKEFGEEVTEILNSLEEDGKLDVDEDGYYIAIEEGGEEEGKEEEEEEVEDNEGPESEEPEEKVEEEEKKEEDVENGEEEVEEKKEVEEENIPGEEEKENDEESQEEEKVEETNNTAGGGTQELNFEEEEKVEDKEPEQNVESEENIDENNTQEPGLEDNNEEDLDNNTGEEPDMEEENNEPSEENQEEQPDMEGQEGMEQPGMEGEENQNMQDPNASTPQPKVENNMSPEELEAYAKKTATVTLLKFYKNSTDENLKEIAAIELKSRGVDIDKEGGDVEGNGNMLPDNKAALDELENWTKNYLGTYDKEDLVNYVVELANQNPGKRKELKDLYREYYSASNAGNKALKIDEEDFKNFLTEHYFNQFTPGDLQSYAFLLISKNPKEYKKYKKMRDIENEPII